MKKTLGRLIIELLAVGLFSFLIGTIVDKFTMITTPEDMLDFQFNIVTITTVFAGFSFSVLGVLISLSSTNVMEKLKETSEMQKSCDVITRSIVFFMVTFFFALFFILGIESFFETILRCRKGYLFALEIGYLLFGIFLFLGSVYRMAYMMHYIFSDNQKNAKKKVDGYIKAAERIKEDMKNFENDDDW